MLNLLYILESIARAGGGGSSGGGSSGGGVELLALIGYLPSYYLGKLVKKLLPRKAELIVSASFAAASSIALLVFFNALDPNFSSVLFSVFIIAGIWIGWSAAFFDTWERLRKRAVKADKTVRQAALVDSAWDKEHLAALARQCFLQYQQDWSTFNIESMRTYMTPSYARHSLLLMAALHELRRRNVVTDIKINQALIIEAHDHTENSYDTFTVAFEAQAHDELVNDNDKSVIHTSTKPFIEYWRFTRNQDVWLLDGITQNTQNLADANQSLRAFAKQNNMFYSLDMGWLLLPSRGLLMTKGKIGASDINNHVVGTHNGRLVQLYTFTPTPAERNFPSWLILQVTLPKTYGGIITQPRRKLFSGTYVKPSKVYKKQTFEWSDFNKRYSVHATDADRLASFELINPGFMAYLYDNDPNVGIEVADNTLYLFKYLGPRTTTDVKYTEYEIMLAIAEKAFKELQL